MLVGVSDAYLVLGRRFTPPNANPALNTSNKFGGATYTPLLVYVFEDGTGTTVTDYSGNDDHATLSSSGLWDDNGVKIDDNGELITAPSPTFSGNEWSVGIVYTSLTASGNTYNKFFSSGDGTVLDSEWQFARSSSDILAEFSIDGSEVGMDIDDLWDTYSHAVLVTADAAAEDRIIYVAGVETDSDLTTAFGMPTLGANFGIANRISDGARPLEGIVGLFVVWDEEISPSDAAEWAADPYSLLNNPPSRDFVTPVPDTNAYYVDSTSVEDAGTRDGSFAHPWKTIAEVNNHGFSNGDDLYFKDGTTVVMTDKLTLDWSGVDTDNKSVIGCYSAEGVFTCSTKPILSGNDWTVPSSIYDGLIHSINQKGFYHIDNLQIYRSGGHGINLSNTYSATPTNVDKYTTIEDCLIYQPWYEGITLGRTGYNTIQNNEVYYSSYGRTQSPYNIPGAGISVNGMNIDGLTEYNTIQGNEIHHGFEGIGMYTGARYNTVTGNTVYDCQTYNIYMSRSRNNIITNNIVYATASARSGANTGHGIVMNTELNAYPTEVPIGWATVTGNMIAGLAKGITFTVDPSTETYGHDSTTLEDNIIVDCNYNYYFERTTYGTWQDNTIGGSGVENKSFIFTGGLSHSNNWAPTGVYFDANYWSSLPPGGNALINALSPSAYSLTKETGWRTLTPGDVDSDDFAFDVEP